MTQDGSVQDRVGRVAQSLAPQFDAVRLKLAQAFASAEDGQVIEQTERIIFEELNHLKTTSQERNGFTKRRPLFPPVARRQKLRNKGADTTGRLTLNGPVSVELRRWQRAGGGSERPGAEVIGLALGQPSVGFREMACDLAVEAAGSFDREAKLMNKWFMRPVSGEKPPGAPGH